MWLPSVDVSVSNQGSVGRSPFHQNCPLAIKSRDYVKELRHDYIGIGGVRGVARGLSVDVL